MSDVWTIRGRLIVYVQSSRKLDGMQNETISISRNRWL